MEYTDKDLACAIVKKDNDLVTKIITELDVNLIFEIPEDETCEGIIYAGYSPLHLACISGSVDVIQTMLKSGAEVNTFGDTWESPLHLACKYGHPECVQELILAGADVNLKHHEIGGDTPLLTSVASYIPGLEKANEYIAIVKLLIKAGCDLNQGDHMGLNPLHIAVIKEDSILTELLLTAGANPDPHSLNVCSPLIRTVEFNSQKNLLLLLDAGCDVNAMNTYPAQTALSVALELSNLPVIFTLLERGADPNISTEVCPLHQSASQRDFVIMWLLIVYGADISSPSPYDCGPVLLGAIRQNSFASMRLLLKLGSDPDQENKLGSTALWTAISCGHFDMAYYLVYYNCKLDMCSLAHFIYRPIMPVILAFEIGAFGFAKFLLFAGAELRPRWFQGSSEPKSFRKSPAVRKWMHQWVSHPRSLKHLCRRIVRAQLGWNPSPSVQTLTFPQPLKDFILLKDIWQERM